jgi:putative spermidine/putrescine transport system permease protein
MERFLRFIRTRWAWALVLPPLLFFLAFFVGPLLYLFFFSLHDVSQAEMYVLFPLMVSNVIRAYGWIAILGRRGVINNVLGDVGLIQAPLPLMYSLETVVVGLLTILLPYMIICLVNALLTVDRNLEEAAQALGAGPGRTFLHVTLPLSTPGIASGLLLVFLLTLSAYVTVQLLGGAQSKMLVSLVYDSVMTFVWPRAAALAFVLLAISLAVATMMLKGIRPQRVQGKG